MAKKKLNRSGNGVRKHIKHKNNIRVRSVRNNALKTRKIFIMSDYTTVTPVRTLTIPGFMQSLRTRDHLYLKWPSFSIEQWNENSIRLLKALCVFRAKLPIYLSCVWVVHSVKWQCDCVFCPAKQFLLISSSGITSDKMPVHSLNQLISSSWRTLLVSQIWSRTETKQFLPTNAFTLQKFHFLGQVMSDKMNTYKIRCDFRRFCSYDYSSCLVIVTVIVY